MKRIAISLAVTAGLLGGVGVVAATPASASTGVYDDQSWWYPGTYYSGTPFGYKGASTPSRDSRADESFCAPPAPASRVLNG